MYNFKNIAGKSVLYSDLIPELEHFFTTRDLVIRSKEQGVNVDTNIDLITNYLNIEPEKFISPVQTHSSNVQIVDGRFEYPDTDALILNDFNHAIYLNFADCVPIIMFDKKNNIGAICHAGWRGTVANISSKTILKMIEVFHSVPKDIFALIGPAISKCCFTVGEDVAEQIKNSVNNLNNLIVENDGLIYADLKLTNYQQMIEIGIPKSNIDICPYCTVCNNDLFFSYRKENATTSRHSAVIKLKP